MSRFESTLDPHLCHCFIASCCILDVHIEHWNLCDCKPAQKNFVSCCSATNAVLQLRFCNYANFFRDLLTGLQFRYDSSLGMKALGYLMCSQSEMSLPVLRLRILAHPGTTDGVHLKPPCQVKTALLGDVTYISVPQISVPTQIRLAYWIFASWALPLIYSGHLIWVVKDIGGEGSHLHLYYLENTFASHIIDGSLEN